MKSLIFAQKGHSCSLSLVVLLLFCLPATALAQGKIDRSGKHVTLRNGKFKPQHAHYNSTADGGAVGWFVTDEAGKAYPAGGYQALGDEDQAEDILVVGTYEALGDKTKEGGSDDVPILGDYQGALDYLRQYYDALIEHDAMLGVHLVSLPGAENPYETFFHALLNDSLDGRLLVEHFGFIELASLGVFDAPAHTPAEPAGPPLAFPSDTYYQNQWNLAQTNLARAVWHPTAVPKKRVRVAIIDSGVGAGQQQHDGLDGLRVRHEPVAPTTGFPFDHGLGMVTLLADANDDGAGITSLLGTWDSDGCYGRPALTTQQPPEILSYNVGDFGPSSVHVARAIRQSIAQNVDVINLSLRLAYSPLVEQAIEDALAANILVVAAAGNYAPADAYKPVAFPASLPGVIAVGSSTADGRVSQASANVGIDVLAPGEDIIVGGYGDVWYEASGTSFAAPHVTATLALLRAVEPSLSPSQARALLAAGPGARGKAKGKTQGHRPRLLDAGAAFNTLLPRRDRVKWNKLATPDACTSNKTAAAAPLMDLADGALEMSTLPTQATLAGNYPNPFNPQTTIRFAVPEAQPVRLAVYNVLGQRVRLLVEGVVEAGVHAVPFEAAGLPSGAYFARLETAAGSQVHTMTLMK